MCLSVCLSPFHAIFQGRKGGPRGAKLSFTMASVPAVLHDGISTLKKITYRNVHHYDWQPRGAKLSFTIASVPAVLQYGISTLKKCTSLRLAILSHVRRYMSGVHMFFFLQIGGGFSNVVLQEQDFVVSPYFPFTSSLLPGDHICSLMSNKPITFL